MPIAVVVAAVADEEHASLGIQRLLGDLRGDAAIVTEPTDLTIAIAHKGFVWLDIEVTGVAAHGSRPELGVDAIVKTGPILVALEQLNRHLADRAHRVLGAGSVHASIIRGGVEPSTIPERCVLTVERRTLPDEPVAVVEAEIEALLDACRLSDGQLTAVAHTVLHRPALETDSEAAVVRALATAVVTVRGTEAEMTGMSYWADSAFISSIDIPTVLFGPSGEGAHADVEWVSRADTVACTHVLLATADAMSRR